MIIGPGSLFTSLLPPLLVPGIREALADTRAARVYVCNVATQVGETERFSASDHLAALARAWTERTAGCRHRQHQHSTRGIPRTIPPHRSGSTSMRAPARTPLIIGRDVVDDDNAHRHDSRKLTAAILELYDERLVARRAVGQRRVSTAATDRDLVAGLRAELAAIEPARRCCRAAERAGLGAAALGHARTPLLARLAVRLEDADGRDIRLGACSP